MLNFLKKKKVKNNSESKEFKPIEGILKSQSLIGSLDINSTTWIFIVEYIESRINTLHKRNENVTLSHEKAQVIRGGIKELKLLLKQGIIKEDE